MATTTKLVASTLENAFEEHGNGFKIRMRGDGTLYECWAREDGFYELREVSGAESLKFKNMNKMVEYIMRRWK